MQTIQPHAPWRQALLALVAVAFHAVPVAAAEIAYVVNFSDYSLSLIDTATDAVTMTAPLPSSVGRPVSIALNPTGSVAYVAHAGSPGGVSIFDTATRSVSATVPVGNEPFALAVTPNGQAVYVTNFASDTVSVIDTASNAVQATVGVGHGPSGIAFSPDGRFAYVTEFHANTVARIETSARTVTAHIPVGKGPIGIAVSSDAIYVANSGDNTLSVLDQTAAVVRGTVAAGTAPVMVVVGSTSHAYVTNQGAGSVSVIDTGALKVVQTITVGAEPFGLALVRGGARLYVVNRSAAAVSAIDTAANAVVNTVAVGSMPFGIAIGSTPDATPTAAGGGACHCSIVPGAPPSPFGNLLLAALPLLLWCGARTRARRRGRRAQRPARA